MKAVRADRQRDAVAQASAEPDVVRNTALSLLSQLVTALLTAFLVLYLTRTLGPHGYGVFSLAVGVGSLVLLPTDFGISSSAARFMAEHRRSSAASLFLADALALKLVTSVLASVALFALAAPVAAAYGSSDLTWPLRAMAVVIFGQSLMMLYSSALISAGQLSSNLGVYTSESVAEVLGTVLLVTLGGGATAAAFGRASGYLVGAAAAAALTWRQFGRPAVAPGSPSRARVGQIARYAGVLFVVSTGWSITTQIDVLLIGAFVGSTQVGFFALTVRLCVLLHYPGLSLSNSISPRLARARDAEPDVRALQLGIKYLLILQAAALAPIIVWAGPIIHLLVGSRYGAAAGVLQASALFVLLQGMGSLTSTTVNYLGESRRRIWIVIVALLIDVVLDVILIPPLGAVGGAIANSAATAFYVPAHLLICTTRLSMSLRPIMLTLGRSLTAAAGMAGVLLLVGRSHLSVGDWVIGALGGLAAYTAVLVVTRELTSADAARGRGVLSRLRPHRPAADAPT